MFCQFVSLGADDDACQETAKLHRDAQPTGQLSIQSSFNTGQCRHRTVSTRDSVNTGQCRHRTVSTRDSVNTGQCQHRTGQCQQTMSTQDSVDTGQCKHRTVSTQDSVNIGLCQQTQNMTVSTALNEPYNSFSVSVLQKYIFSKQGIEVEVIETEMVGCY